MSTSLTSSLFTSASPSSLKECQNLWRVHPVVSQQWEQKNKQLFQDFFGDPLGFFGFFMAGWWRTLPDALGFFCLAPPPLRLRLRLCCQLIAFTRFFFFYILVIAEILRGFFCCFVAVEWCLILDEFVAFFEEPQIWVFFCLAFCLWRPTQLRFSLRRSLQIFIFFFLVLVNQVADSPRKSLRRWTSFKIKKITNKDKVKTWLEWWQTLFESFRNFESSLTILSERRSKD